MVCRLLSPVLEGVVRLSAVCLVALFLLLVALVFLDVGCSHAHLHFERPVSLLRYPLFSCISLACFLVWLSGVAQVHGWYHGALKSRGWMDGRWAHDVVMVDTCAWHGQERGLGMATVLRWEGVEVGTRGWWVRYNVMSVMFPGLDTAWGSEFGCIEKVCVVRKGCRGMCSVRVMWRLDS